MLFNSTDYLFLFLPVVLLLFVYLARSGNTESQINWLILASLVFYGSWNPALVTLIVFSVVVNYFIGHRIAVQREAGNPRMWLVSGVVFNLGLLGYFKYAGFLVENLNALGLWLIPLPDIVLPLAISFFTFQQIAYLVDVSRGECKEYQFRHYALFVLFFPQLIAGPIVHHKEMMPQFENLRRREDFWTDIAVGMTILGIGLFKKVVLADSLSQYADPLFAAAEGDAPISTVDSWIATLSFSFQIYFDFSGYSDMAIGSARMFGIRLPENFRSPYKSASIIEIWSRWHMTLSRFLRDYLYIMLGGNRRGSVRRYVNLFITMLLGGLWHGAAWTYVIWGGLHGLYLCINHFWRAVSAQLGFEEVRNSVLLKPVFILVTFLAWSLALVVFRAPDVGTAIAIMTPGFIGAAEQAAPLLQQTGSASSLGELFAVLGVASPGYLPVYTLLAICGFICWCMPNTQEYMKTYKPVIATDYPLPRGLAGKQWQPVWWAAVTTALMMSLSLLSLSDITEFIYFQF